jgi:hypothetical protein
VRGVFADAIHASFGQPIPNSFLVFCVNLNPQLLEHVTILDEFFLGMKCSPQIKHWRSFFSPHLKMAQHLELQTLAALGGRTPPQMQHNDLILVFILIYGGILISIQTPPSSPANGK